MDGRVKKIRGWPTAAARAVKRWAAAVWKAVKWPFVWFGGFAYNRAIALFVPGWLVLSGFAVWVAISLAGSCPETTLDCPPVQWFRPDNLAEDFRNLLWAASLVFGGAGAGAALINALRRTRLMQAEHALAQRGQDAETFSRAVNQLGSEQTAVRLGAIYALEGLMRGAFADGGDKAFGRQIGETLAAFVREQSAEETATDETTIVEFPTGDEDDGYDVNFSRLAVDREAAVAVLARSWLYTYRPALHEEGGVDLSNAQLTTLRLPDGADLRGFSFDGAVLRGAMLRRANLQEASLDEADMQSALFDRANLKESILSSANLRGAMLSGTSLLGALIVSARLQAAQLYAADLSGAFLLDCDLRWADLSFANLQEAELVGSDFEGADIQGADVSAAQFAYESNWSSAINLTVEQIASARWQQNAPPILPHGMELPHRGDGKPQDDLSPCDESWIREVGPDRAY